MKPELIGIIAALISAASWAAGSFLFKRIGESVSPFGMTLVKGTISIVFLGLALAVTGYGAISTNAVFLLCLSGVIGIAVADTLFFAALQDLGPVALVVFFMMGQILTAVLAIFFLGEMPPLKAWAGIFFTLAGIGTVLWHKISLDKDSKRSGIRGTILGALSMICMSTSTIIAKPALDSVSTIFATLLRMTSGTLCILLFGIFTQQVKDWLAPVRNIKMVTRFVFSVAVVTFGGFWLSLVAIKYVDIAIASTLSATEPLFLIPMAIVLFKEKISAWEVVGIVSATSGVFLIIT
ncbi:DMT family transporter [Desulfobacter postgatei]|uniref:DMT family transporter n=1 Tax=Desulfobacter postgatei TaxID=2293 RepID=UPI00259B79F2|nr:DMT family transporter [uncultured Desulfobacter sp.]